MAGTTANKVLKAVPLEQGLKPATWSNCLVVESVLKILPGEQGLKPNGIAIFSEPEGCFKGSSRRTRIKTVSVQF